MCEASAYRLENGEETLILESVDLVEPEGEDLWRLVSIFGDQKIVRGRIRKMSLVSHRIVFEDVPEP